MKPIFQEMIPRKTPEKSETLINTCVSIIKQPWKKMAEIPQEHDFLIWGIQTFVRKVKQFVRKGVCVSRPSALGPYPRPSAPKYCKIKYNSTI